MVALMDAGFTAVPVAVLARSLVETASQAWWMLDPEVGYIQRVQRLQALRHRSAVEGERAAKADGASADQYRRYGETKDDVERCSRALGLEPPRKDGHVFVCGTERLPTATCRVRQMLADADVPSVYNLYSGFSHGVLFALWSEILPRTTGGGRTIHVPSEETFKGTVSVASYALGQAGGRIAALYGLDAPEAHIRR
jgi:hypothetical protein